MACLIIAESAIFTIFVVAYLYYLGKSASGPQPRDVLELPFFISICLFSSSSHDHLARGQRASGRARLGGVPRLVGGDDRARASSSWPAPASSGDG